MPDPAEQVDQRKLRPKPYGDDARSLLEHVWALMGFPCGKYLAVMLPIWLPLLDEAGDLAKPFTTPASVGELEAMSPATIDRYLAGARRAMTLKGIATTTPPPSLRNSIGISKAGDEPPSVPGVIEADTVAHCGPTLKGEFYRTLTMTDLAAGWTRERVDPQQRVEMGRPGRRRDPGHVPVPAERVRLRQRQRVRQP
jgi:hypothetical protein